MDSSHALSARSDLEHLREQQASVASLLSSQLHGWLHGDLGQSRQFGVPVSSLVKERAARSARTLVAGVTLGWAAALSLALPLSTRRRLGAEAVVAGGTAILLALPVGVLATTCVVANVGGPILVLALVVAVRDFKVVYRMLQSTWDTPYVLHAHAQGLAPHKIISVHVAAVLRRELLSLGMMSFTLALSVLVPLEVVFDVAGLGQLAWAAAMNRDLPVLVAVTGVMAACVGLASFFVEPGKAAGVAQCA